MVGMILRLAVELMVGREFCVPWDEPCASYYWNLRMRSEVKGSGVRTRAWGMMVVKSMVMDVARVFTYPRILQTLHHGLRPRG
eukprot:COSAG05_NODE_2231_length_3360_cov_1.943882_1_plen_83_part_00